MEELCVFLVSLSEKEEVENRKKPLIDLRWINSHGQSKSKAEMIVVELRTIEDPTKSFFMHSVTANIINRGIVCPFAL